MDVPTSVIKVMFFTYLLFIVVVGAVTLALLLLRIMMKLNETF